MGESGRVRVRKPLRTAKEPALVLTYLREYAGSIDIISPGMAGRCAEQPWCLRTEVTERCQW